MNRQTLQAILNRAETEEMLFGWEDVSGWAKGDLDSLRVMKLLRPASPASTMDCSDCERECLAAPVAIVTRPNGTRQAYLECPEYGRIERPTERLSRWQVDTEGLVARLAGELGGTAEELSPGRLWLIGRPEIDGVKTDVLVARGLSWPDGERVLREARSPERSQAAVVLVPARASFDGSPRTVSLDEVLSLDDDGLSVDVSKIREAVCGSAPSVPAAQQGFRASEDYRCVWLHGTQLKPLTKMQSEAVRILDEARMSGEPIIAHAAILSKMHSPPVRLSDIFRSNDPRSVLVERVGKDTYRLNV